jgi:hypothetical protein
VDAAVGEDVAQNQAGADAEKEDGSVDQNMIHGCLRRLGWFATVALSGLWKSLATKILFKNKYLRVFWLKIGFFGWPGRQIRVQRPQNQNCLYGQKA